MKAAGERSMSTPWLTVANSLIGTREKRGAVDNPKIVDMFRLSGHGWVKDDETPWCAAFVGACLRLSGYASTNKLNARSYLDFGQKLKTPRHGCVVVFWRKGKNSGFGHVGFFDREKNGKIYVLGGNQGGAKTEEVNVKGYAKDRLLGYRWPVATADLPADPGNLQTILDLDPVHAAGPASTGTGAATGTGPVVHHAPAPTSSTKETAMDLPKIFFDTVRGPLFGGALNQSAVDNMNLIAEFWLTNHPSNPPNQLAYVLATVLAEVGQNMRPVRESFANSDAEARQKLAHRPYARPAGPFGHAYYGRGYVQLTHLENYERQSQKLGIDLVQFPDRALETHVAIRILVNGMLDGDFNGHGHGLAHYVNATNQDFVGARRTVNIQDRAVEIAGYAQIFLSALQAAAMSQGGTLALTGTGSPSTMPLPHIPPPAAPAPGQDPALAEILALLRLLTGRTETNVSAAPPPTEADTVENALKSDPATAAKLSAALEALEKAGLIQSGANLTPVNAALGQTVGKALDGKKTVLGIGALLISIFLPQLAPLTTFLTGEGAVSDTQSILTPLATLFTGWGALGKIDKWMHKPPVASLKELLARLRDR